MPPGKKILNNTISPTKTNYARKLNEGIELLPFFGGK